MKHVVPMLGLVVLSFSLPYLLGRTASTRRADPPVAVPPLGEASEGSSVELRSEPLTVEPVPHPVWVVAGGGLLPEYNQVQIEQDLMAFQRLLSRSENAGLVLFSAGMRSNVQVLATERSDADALRMWLGDLFDANEGRGSGYRPTEMRPVHGPATAEAILDAVTRSANDSSLPSPFTLYVAGHGGGGRERSESSVLTWGAGDLEVESLAEALERPQRLSRVILTSCYSGGFAELAFADASEETGVAAENRCGFFATVWDRVSAGCDPNPDRGAQSGYGIQLVAALSGTTMAGDDIREEADLDQDGTITLSEAHAYARISSESFDLPTSTSERFLRAVTQSPTDSGLSCCADTDPMEERAVVERLGAALGLTDRNTAQARYDDIQAEIEAENRRIGSLDDELDDRIDSLTAALLHRWPVLNDPWHPAFVQMWEQEHVAIEDFVNSSPLVDPYNRARDAREEAAVAYDTQLVRLARIERLVRAFENIDLVRELRRQGDERWQGYQRLVACERSPL